MSDVSVQCASLRKDRTFWEEKYQLNVANAFSYFYSNTSTKTIAFHSSSSFLSTLIFDSIWLFVLFCFVFLFQNKCESYMNACSATQWMCNAFCVRSCLIKNAHASNVFVECTRANAHQEFCFSFSFKSSLLFWCKSFFLYAFTPIAVQRIDIERNGMKRNGAKFTNYNKSST